MSVRAGLAFGLSGGWWGVAWWAGWAFCVVVYAPPLDQDLGLRPALEDFTVRERVLEPCIKLSHDPFSQGSGGSGIDLGDQFPDALFDQSCFSADGFDPILHGLSNAFRAGFGKDERRDVAQDEEITQGIDQVVRVQLAIRANGQTFPALCVTRPVVSNQWRTKSWCRACGTPFRRRFGTAQSHSSAHDHDVLAAADHMILPLGQPANATPVLACFAGTFSSSRRRNRSTRLSFTCQPASPGSAANRR